MNQESFAEGGEGKPSPQFRVEAAKKEKLWGDDR